MTTSDNIATPTAAPGLDLDAAEKRAAGFRGVFRVMAYDSSDEMLEYIDADHADLDGDDVDTIAQFACDDAVQRAIVGTLNDAPALIAEVRALRARLAESTAAAVGLAAEADGLRSEVARLTAEADETHQILEEPVADWERCVACASNICAHCKEPHADAEMSAHVAACPRSPLVAKLAEAKRLGLEACEFVHSAIRNAPDANSTDLGDMSASAMGHDNTDRIAAALEAL